jgi:hypothetical protein
MKYIIHLYKRKDLYPRYYLYNVFYTSDPISFIKENIINFTTNDFHHIVIYDDNKIWSDKIFEIENVCNKIIKQYKDLV